MSTLKPFINLGPGDSIREELEYYGWEQKDLAEIMGCTEKHISQLITNKVPVTFESACQLSKIFKQSTQFWLNLDSQYRERLKKSEKVKATEAKALIYRYMPVRELRQRIELPSSTDALVSAVKHFWNIKELDFGFLEKELKTCFRQLNGISNLNPYYALSWLQLANQSLTGHRPKVKYNKDKLSSLASDIGSFSVRPNGVNEFVQEIQRCGVAFLQLDHFQKTNIDGASFFDTHRPVIVYTARQDRLDNFWFTMAHELGHVLLHEKTKCKGFIDSLDHLDLSDKREQEADDFARNLLKNKLILEAFERVKRPSSIRIQTVANDLHIHPGIVAGCLQQYKKASASSFLDFKPPVKHFF